LKLEITESVFFEYQENAVEMLNQLRDLGIEINIDDFGTGYSNLNYLMQLPISTLKIDRSFISPIQSNGGNTEIVQTIVTLARNLGMKVIAEGVENHAQLAQLKNLTAKARRAIFSPNRCLRGSPVFFERKRPRHHSRKQFRGRFDTNDDPIKR
jgi:EAL domain-containing protein (putative c-di-GMP-specific phosphodiesterase class I)